jgi:uracil-DNA glycosylase
MAGTTTDEERPAARPERPGAQQWVPEQADGVDALRAAAPACRGCELWEPATQVVFSAGNARAAVALVGEQPGDAEDRRGVPFVGPAGQLLQRALEEAGLARDQVYVTNAVKHFRFTPRGNRRIHATPEAAHVAACKPWLAEELRLVDPRVVVLLGATAAKALLGPAVRIGKDRGHPIERETTRGTKTFFVTTHPSAVLRTPEDARDAAYAALVDDLRAVAGLLSA